MFEFSPDAIEDREYHFNARYDYLSEAFGAEARSLQAQALDERANDCGFTCYAAQRLANEEWNAKLRAAASIRKGKEARGFTLPVNPANDIPF
jgi:hypothetical protein